MRTTHRMVLGDARDLDALADESVELVVTSPPYPMVEMWDEAFTRMNPAVADALADDDGEGAFALMHAELDAAWDEVARVLVDGGLACINVGDATRSLDGAFQVHPNHARILDAMTDRGFVALPGIIWRKPTNAATKFMGSGMLPPNAYPTLEHEHLLVLRKGTDARSFPSGQARRYESAYFWEERNAWFTDLWTDVIGADQALSHGDGRDRSGAFPLAIPYRLIAMFSVHGDTVLDPFVGTGTTAVAAMLGARNSVGVEAEASLVGAFEGRLDGLAEESRALVRRRLEAHRRFVDDHRGAGGELPYTADHHDVPVKTKQERDIVLHVVEAVEVHDDRVEVRHRPYAPD